MKKPDIFISYSSRDRDRVLEISRAIESMGASVWMDRHKIDVGMNYGPEIVQAIRDCKAIALMCSDAALRSRNVKQEIQLAWKYERPYLPLLLERTQFPEQVEYWLEGCQWIEVLDRAAAEWAPGLERALARVGAAGADSPAPDGPTVQPTRPKAGLDGLAAIARFTDQIWPLPREKVARGARSGARGLGAPQDDVEHGYRIGSRVCLALESEVDGHLLMLDEGPEGIIYCLCPSYFAPDTRIASGRTYLPQEKSRYDSFQVTGKPGRERLLAIISDEPLGFDWMPADPGRPARVLTPADVEELLDRLRGLDGDRWTALSTYFEIRT